MGPKQIAPNVYAVSLGIVNTFLIDADGLTLIDTGIPGSAPKILAALRDLGRHPIDIRHVVLTHCHADHTGSLHALQSTTGATTYMHGEDAALVRVGQAARPMRPPPGLINAAVFRLMMSRQAQPMTVEPVAIDHEMGDGDEPPIAGGLRVIGTPGHTAGHVSLFWPTMAVCYSWAMPAPICLAWDTRRSTKTLTTASGASAR